MTHKELLFAVCEAYLKNDSNEIKTYSRNWHPDKKSLICYNFSIGSESERLYMSEEVEQSTNTNISPLIPVNKIVYKIMFQHIQLEITQDEFQTLSEKFEAHIKVQKEKEEQLNIKASEEALRAFLNNQ